MVPGSVIAYGYIDFAEGTPQEVVDAAMEQLHTTGQNMYADSKLPSKWGWLLNYSTGLNKSTLMEDTAGDVQIESLAFPSAATQKAKHNRMSVTATVAVVVAVAAVICAIVCVIILMKRKGAKVASAPVKDQKPKEAQESGNGGISDYLRDLDGMDDGASERTKFSFARVSRHLTRRNNTVDLASFISCTKSSAVVLVCSSCLGFLTCSIPIYS